MKCEWVITYQLPDHSSSIDKIMVTKSQNQDSVNPFVAVVLIMVLDVR